MTSNKIYKLVRALSDPYPGAFFMYNQKKIIVLKANLIKKVNNNFFEKKKYFKMNKAIVFKVKKSFISFEKIKINNNKIVNGNKLNDFIK
jgi:methionyl-tRNA formyltransferase